MIQSSLQVSSPLRRLNPVWLVDRGYGRSGPAPDGSEGERREEEVGHPGSKKSCTPARRITAAPPRGVGSVLSGGGVWGRQEIFQSHPLRKFKPSPGLPSPYIWILVYRNLHATCCVEVPPRADDSDDSLRRMRSR